MPHDPTASGKPPLLSRAQRLQMFQFALHKGKYQIEVSLGAIEQALLTQASWVLKAHKGALLMLYARNMPAIGDYYRFGYALCQSACRDLAKSGDPTVDQAEAAFVFLAARVQVRMDSDMAQARGDAIDLIAHPHFADLPAEAQIMTQGVLGLPL